MNVLALDTATPYLVLGTLRRERALLRGRQHAETIIDDLESFLDWAGLKKADLDLLVVGEGPGSYTGLRVGAALALGLARALQVPLVGAPTLAAVAARGSSLLRPALKARSGHVYTALYRVAGDNIKPLTEPVKVGLDELTADACILLDEPPSGRALALLGLRAYRAGQSGVRTIYL